ncbi:MAG: 2-succinyl-6-hydroxy-2,4-cyclohexadiene-1-carboxylate synthase [Chloroflexi bacterium]|nr:2-succinyl-6-hydroxy-2,4-cyclohexadiene-1-carboxylate synthase [Chloroflexota bacterium]
MARIDVDGLALNVERTGAGPPVVLVHGFTGSTTTWDRLTAVLAPRFEVIAIDVVGHGASDSPTAVDRYQMRRCVDDLVAALRRLGHERAAWLGYSMGARTALQVAAHRPDAVAALVLEGVTAGFADPAERAARIASDEALADRIEREGLEPFVDYWESIPLWNTQGGLSPETVAALRAQRMTNTTIGLANSLRGMGTGAQEPIHERLDTIEAPTLLLTGALDEKFTATGVGLAAAMPNAERCVIAGAGHAVHLEDPGAFESAAATFIERTFGLDAPSR